MKKFVTKKLARNNCKCEDKRSSKQSKRKNSDTRDRAARPNCKYDKS